MALTTLEAAKLHSGDVVRSAVLEMFARESDILMVFPFENINGNAVAYSREKILPGVAFRGVNESYTESTGIINPLTESLVICGGDLDVDKFIVDTMGTDQRAVQESLKIKALAAAWTSKFIKGDSTTEPREFDGLQTRLTGAQLISAGTTANGAALSLNKLDETIDAVDSATHLVMSKAMRRRLTTAARTTTVGGHIDWTQDSFGRRQMVYNDLPILVAYDNNGGTEILPFTEAAASGTDTATSIYVCNFGEARLIGLQNGDMDVRDLGELETAPKFRTRVEWYTGMALYHGRAAARLHQIGDLAVVA